MRGHNLRTSRCAVTVPSLTLSLSLSPASLSSGPSESEADYHWTPSRVERCAVFFLSASCAELIVRHLLEKQKTQRKSALWMEAPLNAAKRSTVGWTRQATEPSTRLLPSPFPTSVSSRPWFTMSSSLWYAKRKITGPIKRTTTSERQQPKRRKKKRRGKKSEVRRGRRRMKSLSLNRGCFAAAMATTRSAWGARAAVLIVTLMALFAGQGKLQCCQMLLPRRISPFTSPLTNTLTFRPVYSDDSVISFKRTESFSNRIPPITPDPAAIKEKV